MVEEEVVEEEVEEEVEKEEEAAATASRQRRWENPGQCVTIGGRRVATVAL